MPPHSEEQSPRDPVARSTRPLPVSHGRSVLSDRNRIATLHRLNLLDTRPEPSFERLVHLAHQILKVPVCILTVVDDRRQYFKAAVGLDGPAAETRQTPLSHSFCQHVVTSGRPLIVDDARVDPLVRNNLAIRDLSVIAYLGVPIQSPNGFVLGSFCLIDSKPRTWETHEIELLKQFAQLVNHEIAARETRAAADAALRASTEQLHRLLGWADCLVWEAQVECTPESWAWRFSIQPSGLFHRLFGERVPPPDVGLWYRFELPEQLEMDRRARDAMLHRLPGYDQEFRVIREGRTTWIRETVTITSTGTDRFWLVGVATDITPLREAEHALRAAQVQMQAVLEHASVGIASVDVDGTFTTWNPAMQQMLGWTGDEIIGRASARLLIGPDETARLARTHLPGEDIRPDDPVTLIGRTLVVRGRAVWELSCQRRDGTSLPVALHLGAIRAQDGTLSGGVIALHDLTARKEIEAKLAQARDQALESSRLKSEFLATMSHEIRTPMNGIMGMAGLLMDTALDERQRGMGQLILSSAEALLEIIDDILDFSKIEAGRLSVEFAPMDLRGLVEESMALLAPRAHEKGIELACEIDPDVPVRVVSDDTRVRQIVMNLAGNAVKFTERGEVVVRVLVREPVHTERVSLRILIQDTGPGIAEHERQRLFQPFVQGDGSHTRRHGGTGLGLAISRQLAHLLGGHLDFESTAGAGSSFWFDFEASVHTPASVPAPRWERSASVLVVDDSRITREILVRQLSALGIPATAAAQPGEALALLHAAAASGPGFALVILDWHMPDSGGLELAKAIRADPSLVGIRLIALSAVAMPGDPNGLSTLGVGRVLTKPVRAAHLQAAVRELLAGNTSSLATSIAPAERPSPAGTVTRPRILLAEDNSANQTVAALLLERMGCQVDIVNNGREALEQLQRAVYDAVLMDCQMPELDGYTATGEIRAGKLSGVDPRIPIVALTAYAMAGDRQRCLAAGMDDYLTKPVRAGMLHEVLLRLGVLRAAPEMLHSPGSGDDRHPTGSGPVVLDRHVLEECRALPGRNGRTLLADIADLYLEIEPSRLQELAAHLDAGEYRTVANLAHTLAGSCANLGANEARAVLLNLEAAAKSGSLEQIRQAHTDALAALRPVRLAVEALRREPGYTQPSGTA